MTTLQDLVLPQDDSPKPKRASVEAWGSVAVAFRRSGNPWAEAIQKIR